LQGLKENVIIGHLIPAGTGIEKYHEFKILNEEDEEASLEADKTMTNIFQEKA